MGKYPVSGFGFIFRWLSRRVIFSKQKKNVPQLGCLVGAPNLAARFGKFGSIKTLHMLRTKEWVGSPGTQRHPLKDRGFLGGEFFHHCKMGGW